MPLTGNLAADHFLASSGDLAVSLFYVLSGLVLTLSNRDPEGRMRRSRNAYFMARTARIYPQYLLAFLLASPFFIAVMLGKYPGTAQRLAHISGNGLAYLSLLQSWTPWTANAWNGPAWSLSDESFFYVVFAFLPLPQKRGLGAWAALSVVALTATAACAQWLTPGNMTAWRFWYFFPPFRLGEFVLGVVAAQALRLGVGTAIWRARANLAAPAAFAAVIAAAIGGDPVLVRLVSSLFLPVALLALAASKGWLARLLSCAPLVLLGEASFGLYLIQVPVHDFYAALQGAGRLPAPTTPPGFAAYALLAVGVSVLLHLYFERPAAEGVKRLWRHWQGPPRAG